jgi:hypothetical protein
MSSTLLSRARASLVGVTKRPWHVDTYTHSADPRRHRFRVMYTATDAYNLGAKFGLASVELYGSGDGDDERNASFIADSRTLVPDLIARVEELEALLREACDLGVGTAWQISGTVAERLATIRASLTADGKGE